MYQRIKNRLDAELFSEDLRRANVDKAVIKRIGELVAILDENYGACRSSADMGGYLLFFSDGMTYEKCYPHIIEFYHLKEELSEYSQRINEKTDSEMEWWEELYLLSSDDALVLIYPKESACSHADSECAKIVQEGRLE